MIIIGANFDESVVPTTTNSARGDVLSLRAEDHCTPVFFGIHNFFCYSQFYMSP